MLKASVIATQEAAKAKEIARNVRVAQEQEAISNDIMQNYHGKLAALRARYQRLSAQGAGDTPGGEPLPDLPATPGGTVEATVPALKYDEVALQLDTLISWTIRQHEVDPNKMEAPEFGKEKGQP